MKTLILTISILCFSLKAQINFENKISSNNFQKTDSAIRANEFGEIHSLVIIKDGNLIFEKYYHDWKQDSVHQLQSATKSIISLLLGCAITQNKIPSVKEKISIYYPFIRDPLKEKITIEDLLTQRHGLKWKENPWDDPDNTWRKVLASEGNWYKTILETPMDTLPGRVFNYSNAAPVLVTGIIQEATKMPIHKFAEYSLFKPLSIKNYRFWQGNGGPQNNGMALLFLTSRDMAKIGQLYLQNGKWNNQQLVDPDYMKQSIQAHVKNIEANGVYSAYDYGYFWWSNSVWRSSKDKKPLPVYMARGAGGQNIIVYPEKNTVVVITAWNIQRSNKPQEIFDKYILEEI